MWFGYLTLAVAFFLSVVAAYYSVLGLVAIFSAAVIPVMIMGGALETGKVVAAMWLHRNWHRAPWTYKAYLLPSLLALMLLTSMGTFGYLSKAHSDQSLVSGDVTSKIALYDEKIRIAKENIDANRAALKQLDASVDQTLSRSTTEQGAERSVQIRRQQGPERTRLLRDIETEQKKIAQLNEERAPIAAEVRKVEAEVGPIKYIAALLYGDNPENNLLEAAVRWVIILIVVVFDPLAIVLILAGTRHLEWERSQKIQAVMSKQTDDETEIETLTSITSTTTTTTQPPVNHEYLNKQGIWFKWKPFPKPVLPAYLRKAWISKVSGINVGPQVYLEKTTSTSSSTTTTTTTTTTQAPLPDFEIIGDDFILLPGEKPMHISVIRNLYPRIYSQVVTELDKKNKNVITFGSTLPKKPYKNQYHISTDTFPHKVYKYFNQGWSEVDKLENDSYTSNEEYIQYLIRQIENKNITPQDLTEFEQKLIAERINNDKSTNNPT